MKFTVHGKKLNEALGKIGAVVGKMDFVNIESNKKEGLWVTASGNDSVISIRVDAKVEKEGKITVNNGIISGVTRNRAEVQMELRKNDMTFRQETGRYNGDFILLPFTDIPFVVEQNDKEMKFTKAIQSLLDLSISKISLENVFNDDPIYVWLSSDGKTGTTIVCADDLHIAHYHHPEIDLGKKSFSLPLATFKTLYTLSGGASYKLNVADSHVYAYNDNMRVIMPITQADADKNIKMLDGFVAGLNSKTKFKIPIAKESILNVLDNASSIFDNKSPLKITSAKDKVTLSVETSYGKINETFKAEGAVWTKEGATCEAALISDLLRAIKASKFVLKMEKDKCLFVQIDEKPAKLTYVCVMAGS